ncbi:MAG: S41 family peptidase [Bacteroidota bacterium]
MDALCKDVFPNINNTFPTTERQLLLDSLLSNLSKKANDIEFVKSNLHYLAQFNNEHTQAGFVPPQQWVPVRFHFVDRDWYIIDVAMEYDSTLIGNRITHINEKPIRNVEHTFFKYVSAENEINKRKVAQRFFKYPDYYRLFGLAEQTDSLSLRFENGKSIWIDSIQRTDSVRFHIAGSDKFYPYSNHHKHKITYYREHHYDFSVYPDKNYAYLQFNRSNDLVDALDTMDDYLKPWITPFAKFYLKRQVRKKKEDKIRGFVDVGRPVFGEYISSMIDSINSNQIDNLIIDLRHNIGGSGTLFKQLMYHLTNRNDLNGYQKFYYYSEFQKSRDKKRFKEFEQQYTEQFNSNPQLGKLYSAELLKPDKTFFDPVNRTDSPYYIPSDRHVFKGNIYILANYGTHSAAALFTTLMQDNQLATIIGTSVANNPTGATSLTPFRLPNSELYVEIASSYRVRPDSSKGKIQKPDYWIENTVPDILKGNDQVFDKALELIYSQN